MADPDMNREIGRLGAQVEGLSEQIAGLRQDIRDGNERVSRRLNNHGNRLGSLERFKAGLVAGAAFVSALVTGVINLAFKKFGGA